MPAAAAIYRGGYLPFSRGYAYRSASTQAHEADRNLMFYYEHLNLYDPRQARRASNLDDETWDDEPRRERNSSGAQLGLPPSPPRTLTPTPIVENDGDSEESSEEDQSEVETPGEGSVSLAHGLAGHDALRNENEPVSQPKPDEFEPEEESGSEHEPASESDSEPQSESVPIAAAEDEGSEPQRVREQQASTRNIEVSTLTIPPTHDNDDQAPRMSTDTPPSYHTPSIRPPSYLNHHTSTLLESNSPPALTENLRRFLLFTLAIDYDLVSSCPEPLDQADWLPYVRLARHWAWRDSRQRYLQGYDPIKPAFLGNPGTSEAAADDERALRIEQCIFAVVVRPAAALGVPPGKS